MNIVKFIKSLIPSKSIKPQRQNIQNKTFAPKQTFKMPLVVPGINSSGDASKTEEWQNKLVGKKLGEGASDEVVGLLNEGRRNVCANAI